MIFPTKFGYGLACLALLMYIASMQELSGLLFLVLGIIIGCYIYNLIAAIRHLSSLRITPANTLTATEGQPVRGTWTFRNPTSRMRGFIEIKSTWGPLFRVGAIPPGECIRRSPELTLVKRGVYPYTGLTVSCGFPFGLIRYQRPFDRAGEILVYPSVYHCDPPHAGGFIPMLGGQMKGKYRTSMGDQFHGVRPMQERDPVKLIHWPSSSKGQGMMVKEFDEELSGRVCVLVDSRRNSTPEDSPALDWAARAAGSLALAALDKGNQISLANLGTGEISHVSPFNGSDIVLEIMARMEEHQAATVITHLEDILAHVPKKSSLCFVLIGEDRDLPGFLQENPACAKRLIFVYLPDFVENTAWLKGYPICRYSAHQIYHGR
ncbi:MAG: DUF58 domain-containing protein [bacterium]